MDTAGEAVPSGAGDPFPIRFEQTRTRLPKVYNLLWFVVMATFIVLLFLVRR